MPRVDSPRTISRPVSLGLLLVTCALAYLSRSRPIGIYFWDKSLGDALYAIAAYLVLLLMFPAIRPLSAFGIATAFCFVIEAFKLTGLPAAWAQSHFRLVSRLTLGTTPSLHNLLCYLAATTLAFLAHRLRR